MSQLQCLQHYQNNYKVLQIAVVLVVALSACGNPVENTPSLRTWWDGTQTDGTTISLEVFSETPDIGAHIYIGDGDSRIIRDIFGTYVGSALNLNATDTLGTINFNATVSSNSMTGSYIILEVENTDGTGVSFSMTKRSSSKE